MFFSSSIFIIFLRKVVCLLLAYAAFPSLEGQTVCSCGNVKSRDFRFLPADRAAVVGSSVPQDLPSILQLHSENEGLCGRFRLYPVAEAHRSEPPESIQRRGGLVLLHAAVPLSQITQRSRHNRLVSQSFLKSLYAVWQKGTRSGPPRFLPDRSGCSPFSFNRFALDAYVRARCSRNALHNYKMQQEILD